MNRILVPTDFSEISQNAFEVAIKIARKFDAEIYFLNIVEPSVKAGFSASGSFAADIVLTEDDRFILELHQINKEKLINTVWETDTTGVGVYPSVAINKMEYGTLNFIDKYDIDLVVMGTSAENTYNEMFSGNHTEKIMRGASCPVLAIKSSVDDFDINNIVIATGLDSGNIKGMKYIKKILTHFNPHVHLLHIATGSSIVIDEVNKKLNAFAKKHEIQNYTSNVIHHKDLKRGIYQFAKEIDADIVTAFTHGRGGFSQYFNKNLCEDLVKEAHMPVLSVHLEY